MVTSRAKNAYLRQTLNLRQGVYIVTFEYAPKKGKISSSPMALVWNGRVIENFYPSDDSVRVFATELIATNGNNSLEFRAIGKEDFYSMAISNVQVVPSTLLLYFNPISRSLDWTSSNGGNLVSVPYTPGALQSSGSNSVPEGLVTLVNNNNFAAVPNDMLQLFSQNNILTQGGELPGDFSTWSHSLNYFNNSQNGLNFGFTGANNGIGNLNNNGLVLGNNGNILSSQVLNNNLLGNVAPVNSLLSSNLDGILGSRLNGNFNPVNPLLNGNLNSNFQNIGTGIDSNGNAGQIVNTNSYIVAGDPSLSPAVISSSRYQDLVNGGTLIHNGLSDESTTVLNKITNGRFIYPSIGYSSYRGLTSISHWEIKDVRIYTGYYHNKNWGNRFVLELAAIAKSNGFIRQTVNLQSGTYVLTFDYAARERKIDTSGLLVVWNGQEIKDVNAFDEIVRTMRLELPAANGQNTL